MRVVSTISLWIIFLLGAPVLAQDPPGTRVLRPSPATGVNLEPQDSLDQTEVELLYKSNGSPRIVLFIDRELLDIVGEWETYSRSVSEQSMNSDIAVNSTDSAACTFMIQRIANTSTCNFRVANFEERRNRRDAQQRSVAIGTELQRGQFEAGFQSALLEYGLILVDREMILRQTSLSSGGSQDFYDLEISSLNGYADYVAEILLVPDPTSEYGVSYRTNVNNVITGQIIAVSISNGQEGVLPQVTERWEPVANGYEKVVDIFLPQFSAYESGQKIGENLLSAMVTTWRTNQSSN